ncbi:hypothetical protein H5410_004102 [Solanum commersonii]|uniref:Uncharacterized protein n=1 Tax=Solanum commersonii TaxID=4109 RepID=A0A9J6B6T6_SOLCO|nr:hypothetical protein H5410_004102 [Solanum commersonii]
MDHRLWMYNMHYETGAGLKLEFIDEARRFYDQLEKSSRPLCEGSLHSALSVAVRLMNIKSDWNTHVRKKENELDPNVWVEERAEQTFFQHYVAENLDSSVEMIPELSTQIWKEKVVGGIHKGRVYGLEGIGSSSQAEAFDGVQIAAMSDQIAKLIAALTESERRRVAEQENMSKTIHHIQK